MGLKMPFLRPRILAAVALVFAAGVVGVLYVIHASSVHALGKPPADLARLVVSHEPAKVPTVAFSDADGKHDTLASFHGHYVLLNLWATWCAPCVKELPQLTKLKSAYPELDVVAVNVGRDNAVQTATFLQSHDAGNLTVFVDSDSALIRAFSADGLPVTVLVDPDGREIARAVGPFDWGTPAAVAYLRELISAGSRAAS